MAAPIRKALDVVYLAGIVLASLCLAAQLVIITVNVILRYFFNSGISWVEEISKDVLMTAFTFLAMAVGVALDSHINVDLFPRWTPAWLNAALEVLKQLVVGAAGLMLAWYGVSLIRSVRGSIASVPSLPISLQYLLLPLAGFLIFCESLLNLLRVEKGGRSLDERFMAIGGKR